MGTMLTINDINVFYGAIHAIKGVSLEVNEGEIVTLIGANGAGKSTILRTISGLLKPKTGSIQFEGQEIAGMPAHEIVKTGISQVPEGRRIFAEMSVLENLELGIEIPALPVSVMVLPDGTVFAGASLGVPAEDLEQWAKGTLTPRQQDKARDGMQSLQNMMNDKLDKLEKGVSKYTGMMDGTKQKGAWGDPEESLLVGVMFGFLGGYNKNTGM